MKKLLIFLLFVPLLSFGQNDADELLIESERVRRQWDLELEKELT